MDILDSGRSPNAVGVHAGTKQVDFEVDTPEQTHSISKRALRAVINAPTTTPTKTILSLLNLSPLETRLKLKLLVHIFRCIHNKASSLLCAQYQVRSPTHSTHRTTKAQTYTSLIIPRVSKSAGAKSPAFFSTLLWNELPSDLRSLSSVHSFWQKLMVYLDSL